MGRHARFIRRHRIGRRAVVLAVAALLTGVLAAPTAAAHDPDCTLTLHAGPLKVHHGCEENAPPGKECLVSLQVEFVKVDLMCR